MKPSLFLPALLFAALPATLNAAPGTVNTVLQEIADGVPGGMPSGSLVAGGSFGSACAPLGDLDGDGNPDLAVGRSGNNSVYILFLAADGSVESSVRIANGSGGLPAATVGSGFGISVALLGDLDGDGLPELAVGAFNENAVYLLFLNADGTVRRNVRIADGSGGLPAATTGATQFGASCAAVGDLDGNGVTELAVGANLDNTGFPDAGALYVLFLNPDGTVGSFEKIAHGLGGFPTGLLDESDRFGSSCTSLGDLDGDGFPELAVGALRDDTGGPDRGAVYLISLDQDGTVDGTPVIIAHGSGGLSLSNANNFGDSVVPLGDVNGDGVTDLAVGASGDNTGGGGFGAIHVLFLNPNGTVASTSKIADNVGGLPDNTIVDTLANFGFSLAVLGRSPDNGLPLLAVGSPGDDSGGNFAGAVFLLELGDPPLKVTTLTDEFDNPSGAALSLREAMRDADTAGEFRTIRFDPALIGGTIELQGPLSAETQSLRITGEDLADGLTLRMTAGFRIFTLIDADLSLDSLTVSDGFTNAQGAAGFRVDGNSSLTLHRVTVANCVDETSTGGGIFNQGRLVVTDSTFVGNRSDSGGAILNSGASSTLSVLNSTFSDNGTPNALGGAILSSQPMVIRHCTFVGNTADDGGAIASFGACTLSNSLFTGNTAATDPDFDVNDVTNGGGNAQVALSEVMPLADYGGPTQTQPLKPTSSSKSTVAFKTFPLTDQRGVGFPRTRGTGRDPGAVEGLENSDFQPDNRIGLTSGKQIGNNVYNTSGQGQTVKLTLSGRKKTSSFFTVENDGVIRDTIRLRSVAPKKKTLKGSVFRLTGGRSNVSAQVFGTGLALGELNPGAALAFQADWSRKSATLKAKQNLKITASSTIALKSDVVGAKVGSK
jgi:predicted outer membrane repeat protein